MTGVQSLLPYWQHWDDLVSYATANGNSASLPAIKFHFYSAAASFSFFCAIVFFTVPAGAKNWHELILAKTLVYNFLMNFLGLHFMYTGPIYGESKTWRHQKRRFMTGIPIRRGWFGGWLPSTRQWFDVVYVLMVIATSGHMLLCGENISRQVVLALASLLLSGWLVVDHGMWIGSYGMSFHWPLLWMLQLYVYPTFNALPALQVWVLGVYIGCGTSKIGPWWELGFANEWVSPPPFAGRKWLMDLFIKDANNCDFRATRLASLSSHARWACSLCGCAVTFNNSTVYCSGVCGGSHVQCEV